MGKKRDAKSENAASKKQAKDEKSAVKAKIKAKSGEATVVESAADRSATRKPKASQITLADIQLRAYFVAEKRHREGRPGNEESDWLEAERLLRKERSVKSKETRPSKIKPQGTAKKAARKPANKKKQAA